MNPPEDLPDRIQLRSGETIRQLTVQEFLQIDLHAQVDFLLRGDVTFYSGNIELRALDALKALNTFKKQR